MGYQAVAGEHSRAGEAEDITDEYAISKLKESKYKAYKDKYDNVNGIPLVKKHRQNAILSEFKKNVLAKEQKNINDLNREGTAIGYKSFARGNEATAMGNDVVAWGGFKYSYRV